MSEKFFDEKNCQIVAERVYLGYKKTIINFLIATIIIAVVFLWSYFYAGKIWDEDELLFNGAQTYSADSEIEYLMNDYYEWGDDYDDEYDIGDEEVIEYTMNSIQMHICFSAVLIEGLFLIDTIVTLIRVRINNRKDPILIVYSNGFFRIKLDEGFLETPMENIYKVRHKLKEETSYKYRGIRGTIIETTTYNFGVLRIWIEGEFGREKIVLKNVYQPDKVVQLINSLIGAAD